MQLHLSRGLSVIREALPNLALLGAIPLSVALVMGALERLLTAKDDKRG